MKPRVAATLICLSVIAPPVLACGTRLPEVQQKIDAGQLQRLRALTVELAQASDVIVVGTVTALEQPVHGSPDVGSVTLAVSETLKGVHSPIRVLAWRPAGVAYSCDQSNYFESVGFRDAGAYIVYVKDGRVVRAAAADELRESSLLKLAEELELVAAHAHAGQ